MSIAAAVNQAIERAPAGRIFGYEVFPQYREAPEAVVRAVNRGVENRRLKRVAKGRFYKSRRGALGDVPVSDQECVRDAMYRDGRRVGYVTGPALYNRLGLTTQMPRTIAVAVNGATRIKDFGTIRIRLLSRRAPISDSTVPLLETLDVLRDARTVPDASIGRVVQAMTKRLAECTAAERKRLQRLALAYYSPGARALLGMLLTRLDLEVLPALQASLNPTTRFDLGLDPADWPESQAWNIR